MIALSLVLSSNYNLRIGSTNESELNQSKLDLILNRDYRLHSNVRTKFSTVYQIRYYKVDSHIQFNSQFIESVHQVVLAHEPLLRVRMNISDEHLGQTDLKHFKFKKNSFNFHKDEK